jgi:hypothetical protein
MLGDEVCAYCEVLKIQTGTTTKKNSKAVKSEKQQNFLK